MKNDKSLIEVWEWKEKAYEELKKKSAAELVNAIKNNANKLINEYGINDNLPETRKIA